MAFELSFQHRHKPFRLCVTDAGVLELYVDDCLRKSRSPGPRQPQYVWTNVELEWEEHHYVEARFWEDSGRLQITINRDVVIDRIVSDGESSATALPG